MAIGVEAISQEPHEDNKPEPKIDRHELNRLIVHLARTFSRSHDIRVLPSGQKGFWACGPSPEIYSEVNKYLEGERDTLDDIPSESFRPKIILYDEEEAMEMTKDEIYTLLHHEAGHAKFTDYKQMYEGQRHAKEDGYLPTSFWLAFEGIEDPRVNTLEGEESPAIDRQIRTNQGKGLQKRITEIPLSQRSKMLQFAYNSFYYWLHDEGIPELAGTDVGRLWEVARPLLRQYFENTDLEQRKILQKQIWDIAKELEKKEIEQEEKRQMAQRKKSGQGQSNQGQQEKGQPQSGLREGQQSAGQQGSSDGEKQSGGGQIGQGESQQGIPSGSSDGGQGQSSSETQNRQGQGNQSEGENKHQGGRRGFLDKLRDKLLGQKNSDSSGQEDDRQASSQGEISSGGQPRDNGDQPGKQGKKQKPEKIDLSKLTPEELQQIQDAINQLTPQERLELTRKAREAVDETQKEALEEELGRTMKLEKNQKTGEYEIRPGIADENNLKQSEEDYRKTLQQVEEEERKEWERQGEERRQQEEMLKQLGAERREKLEMEKAGFDEDEREKFLLYQSLEDSMYANVRNFKQAIEKVIPRKKEATYESGYFSGSKIDKRELIRRAPVGDERFHMRQIERPTGEPRLYVALLIDDTLSTLGKKQEEIRKASIFFAKALRDINVPLMMVSFGEKAEIIKKFSQDFDDPSQRIKPKLIDATDASAGRTNLYLGIEAAIEAMNDQRRRLKDSHGLILVITDGKANEGKTGDALGNYIEENKGRLTFKAFGLSGDTEEREEIQEYLNNYFGESNCAYPQSFEDLPDEAFRVLRVNLIQFQKFLS